MIGVELTPNCSVESVTQLAKRSEAKGFDSVFTSCHYFNRDPFLTLGNVATETADIRLGPVACNLYERHPATLVSQTATLNEIANGRVVVSLAAGDRSTLSDLGLQQEKPLRRILEFLKTARALFSEEVVTHDGTFEMESVQLEFKSSPPLLYVSAQGKHMIRMGAKHADGVLIPAAGAADTEWALEQVQIGAQQRPSDDDPDVIAYMPISVADTKAEADEYAAGPVSFIVAGASEATLRRNGISIEEARSLREVVERDKAEGANRVSREMIDAFCISGRPEQVSDQLRSIVSTTRINGVIVAPPLGPDIKGVIDRVASAYIE